MLSTLPLLLLQEGAIAQSPVSNHTIAILCAESYDDLFTGLADIWEEVSDLTVLDVDGCTFTIIFFLRGRLEVVGNGMWH